LAHEVQEVIPTAVSCTKDRVDKDGCALYQVIDHSKFVPLLKVALPGQEAVLTTQLPPEMTQFAGDTLLYAVKYSGKHFRL
jgi:hypothetical protein